MKRSVIVEQALKQALKKAGGSRSLHFLRACPWLELGGDLEGFVRHASFPRVWTPYVLDAV